MWYDCGMDSASPLRYVNLPAREVYDPDLPDALFRTLAQVRGLAYRFKGKRTPPLTVEDLAALRGLSRATIFKHLAELRERGIVRIEPVDEHAFIVRLLRRKQDKQRRKTVQAKGEATLRGARDDGTAATAEKHHVAVFPLRWGSGATTPAFERGDAAQAKPGGPPQPGRDGHRANGANLAGAYDGAERRRAALHAPSPGPPPLPPLDGTGRGRQGENGSLKNETRSLKNETQSLKNETRSCHVVVHVHDSKQEKEKQQHDHDGALLKNAGGPQKGIDSPKNGVDNPKSGTGNPKNGADRFGGELPALAEVLAGHGMRPGDAQRRARRLLEEHGAEVCARQRQAFERRCELARASPRGLGNPVGLLCASIRGDWSLPPAEVEPKAKRWYTDEEFELFFEH
jgi:DNA-binding transcriptional ArsR family regulator